MAKQNDARSQDDPGTLLERISQLEDQIKLLKFAAGSIERSRAADPADCYDRAQEVVRKSMDGSSMGKNTWIVTVPGFVNAVYFNSDAETEPAAIREFETRFGTRFITSNQRESDNHKIERAR